MRLPLGVSIESRDGTVDQDAKVVNGVVEVKGESTVVRKRPGMSDLGLVDAGAAQFLMVWNGIKLITDDVLNAGTIATIVSSPTRTTLTTTNDNLPMDGAATNNDAATPRLFFKNRSQAWTVTRAGAVSSVTYGGNMGANTYTVTITRSGTTATATLAEDVFNVGDDVVIAGADQAAYNGTKSVTAVTIGSNTPAREIPITITRSGTTATATTVSGDDHGLTTATAYTIAGAGEAAYNGSKTITTSGGTTFTYTVTVTAGAAITGTWNVADKAPAITLSGGDLTITAPSNTNSYAGVRGTVSKSAGRWAWEVTITNVGQALDVGVASSGQSLTATPTSTTTAWVYRSSGGLWHNGSSDSVSPFTTGDKIGVVFDGDNDLVQFYKNGTFVGALTGVAGAVFPYLNVVAFGSLTPPAVATANFSGTFTHDYDDPYTPASGSITVIDPARTVAPTFSYAVAGSPATPATGTITAQGNGGTVPGTAYINGYFVVMDKNGVIWHSNSDDPTTWGSLAFVTAQVENGAGMALAKSQNYLVAFKEWSTELFYDAANEIGSVFSPVDNGFTRIGCASGFSVADVGGKLLWIAQTREEQGRSVYMGVGLDQVKVSTPDVDRIVSRDDLSTVHAYGLSLGGHSLYVLTLVNSNITLVYDLDSKAWVQWSSLTISSAGTPTSITRSGDIATITFSEGGGPSGGDVGDGAAFKISGANQGQYNGIFHVRRTSSTTYEFEVHDAPATPATGTISVYAFTESYFKFVKAASYQGQTLLLHESDGHLYRLETNPETIDGTSSIATFRDDDAPINFFIRTSRIDGGTTNRKKMPLLRVIADKVDDVAMLRWSDDDCGTYTGYRPVDLNTNEPELRRCGAFKRRTIEFRHVGNNPVQVAALETDIL